MPAISASAPGKIILLGEHAVVYGQPAIAVPVNQVRAKAILTANPHGVPGSMHVEAPAIELDAQLGELPSNDPLVVAVQGTLAELGIDRLPACSLRITSSIPVASGLGSGAAVAVAVIRALSTFLGHPLSDKRTSEIAYNVEKIHHGTPSGIDNTVVTFAKPIYYVKNRPIVLLRVPRTFTIIIGSTGISSPTAAAVGEVRRLWQEDPARWERVFTEIGEISKQARQFIESGRPYDIGPLMNEDHRLLQEMGVSSPELDHLVNAARGAGAPGAKLSGGGWGGNMIALAPPDAAGAIARAIASGGAAQTIITTIGS